MILDYRVCRTLAGVLCLTICFIDIAAGAAVPARSGLFSVRLESDQTVYRPGQPIELRITLTDKASQAFQTEAGPPFSLTSLIVRDAEGRTLHSLGSSGFSQLNIMPYTFSPQKPILLEYPDPKGNGRVTAWANIRRWGYDLTQPGTYYITAYPHFAAAPVGATGDQFLTPSSDLSNRIRITILGSVH